jgi:hypothetical protein
MIAPLFMKGFSMYQEYKGGGHCGLRDLNMINQQNKQPTFFNFKDDNSLKLV